MNKELDFVKGMFDRIAPKYDFLNRLLSLRQDVLWREQAVEACRLKPGSRILDVACGTCDVALEASLHLRGQAKITGLDFSHNMLKLGHEKIKQRGNKTIQLLNGDALNLPVKNNIFDAVFIAFGIRNIMDRKQALKSFYDALKPGGRLAVLELTTPENKWFKTLYLTYFQKILPEIGAWFSKDSHAYTYLPQSVLNFPPAHRFAGLMKEEGFKKIKYKQMTFGIVTLFIGTK